MKPSEFSMRPWPLVLNSSQFQLSVELENLKAKAEQTLKSINAQKEKALKEGFEEGFNQAKIENTGKFLRFLKQTETEILKFKEEILQQIPSVINEIAVEFIGLELTQNKDFLKARIRKLIENMPEVQNMEIEVHESEVNKVKNILSRLNLQSFSFSVIPVKDLNKADIIIRTENGILDGSLETLKKEINKIFE